RGALHSFKIFGQLVLLPVSKGEARGKQANYNRHQYPSAPRRSAEHRGIDELLFALEPSYEGTPKLCKVGRNVDLGIVVCIEKRFARDRKSTRLNSSHVAISYAVFCLKKKTSL